MFKFYCQKNFAIIIKHETKKKKKTRTKQEGKTYRDKKK